MPVAPHLLVHSLSFFFPHTGWLLWLFLAAALSLLLFSSLLPTCTMPFFAFLLFLYSCNAMMPLYGNFFLFSPDATLQKFFKSHANLTMPLSGYWKLWLPVGTKIELGIVLHVMQASSQGKQQSNCAAGGSPKFPEIRNHGCQSACGIELYMLPGSGVTWQHLWQHPENITAVPYGDACTWQLTAKLHVFWSKTIINQSCHLSIFRAI